MGKAEASSLARIRTSPNSALIYKRSITVLENFYSKFWTPKMERGVGKKEDSLPTAFDAGKKYSF